MEFQIIKNEGRSRFELQLSGAQAFVDFIEIGKKIVFTHTEVPVGFEGEGIGSLLAQHVIDYARHKKLEVIPLCPFIAAWLRKHPDQQDVLSPDIELA